MCLAFFYQDYYAFMLIPMYANLIYSYLIYSSNNKKPFSLHQNRKCFHFTTDCKIIIAILFYFRSVNISVTDFSFYSHGSSTELNPLRLDTGLQGNLKADF